MKHYTFDKIQGMDRIPRMNLINSVSGFKPAHLIGTKSNKTGIENLGIFSSIFHISASPPHLGFMMRPHTIERHTLENIELTEFYTMNAVHKQIISHSHMTSAKFERGESEFAGVGLTPTYSDNFFAPYVAESKIQIGLRLDEILEVKVNKALLIIGKIEHIYLKNETDPLFKDHTINHYDLETVAINGLYNYALPSNFETYEYARKEEGLRKKNI